MVRERLTGAAIGAAILFAVLGYPYGSALAQSRQPRTAATVLALGSEGNAWSAASVAINGTSTALDTQWAPFCDAFGNTSGAATLTVQKSQNGSTWYTSATNTGSVTGNFGINFTSGARYVRLISNAAVTITATLACKAQ